jgi:glycine dehydrogenase subunit 1
LNYIPHSTDEIIEMLSKIGISSIEELFSYMPNDIFLDVNGIDKGLDELSLFSYISKTADKNILSKSFLGAGSYNHYTPALIDYIISRGEFLTAYTPYQPEISQGTLKAIYEFQSMMCELTGMEVSNASMYDGATALAEGMLMAKNITGENKMLLSEAINPLYLQVLKTYAWANDITIEYITLDKTKTSKNDLKNKLAYDVAGVFIQSPNFFGSIEDISEIKDIISDTNIVYGICVSEPTSFALFESPGKLGADIVTGEAQSFGNKMNFGGPGLGFFTTKLKNVRKMPGRIVGKTKDVDNKDGYVLTLSAREQHIRREKATSNICSNHSLCAVAAAIYLSVLGNSLQDLANLNFQRAHFLAEEINNIDGFEVLTSGTFYNEFVVKCKDSKKVLDELSKKGINGGYDIGLKYPQFENSILVCVTEMNSADDMKEYLQALKDIK